MNEEIPMHLLHNAQSAHGGGPIMEAVLANAQ